ncbi:ABC transporter permease [Pseudoalteromonas luteoviolacea]|uniref:MacB-like periplasmic core domain-containing protein n=1 Tax=Pseudoalteromonas luteoviolacea NCIMB 1942 TaxID=1365253 RepID=A0A161XY76_9GAMM|nr:ABC transporter permease [Pseudoalteromonas luteoviolacea]KZN48269.1 hypothetical protein N482_08350 [Pseudoalteromonas luteoviolacea NCIMB 1942]
MSSNQVHLVAKLEANTDVQRSDVARAGVGSYPTVSYWLEEFATRHMQLEPGRDKPIIANKRVWGTRLYFETFGLTLKQGRHFTDAEARESTPVVIINEFMADLLKDRGQNPIDAKLYARSSSDPITVIGVVGNLNLPNQAPIAHVYRPRINTFYPMIIAQTKPSAQISRPEINTLLTQVHPQIRVYDMQTTEQILSAHLKSQRVASMFTIVLSLVAIALATYLVIPLLLGVMNWGSECPLAAPKQYSNWS